MGLSVAPSCGDGGAPASDETPTRSPQPSATVAENSRFVPPLEGPERPVSSERTNYRELPEFELPDPAALPPVSAEAEGREFHPPAAADCPASWERLTRPAEGFEICYPPGWVIDGHGYVTGGADELWYSVGIYRLIGDDKQSAHVSIYTTGPFSRPFTYVRECEQAYRVALAGTPASLCPDHPGVFPETRIIAYHLRQGDRDYFVQAVPYFTWDQQDRRYLSTWRAEDEETAIRIAQTFHLLQPGSTPAPTAAAQ